MFAAQAVESPTQPLAVTSSEAGASPASSPHLSSGAAAGSALEEARRIAMPEDYSQSRGSACYISSLQAPFGSDDIYRCSRNIV